MKNHSFFQILLLAVFGSLAVAGILVFAFAVGGGSSTAGVGKVVIWGTFNEAAFNTVLQAAGSANPQLQDVTYVQKNADSYEQDLSQALADGDGPDLFILPSDYAIKDMPEIATIPFSASASLVQFQTLFAEAADPYLASSSIIAIPVLVDPLVLYWNKDLLAAAGYAQPPQYWDDVPAMAATLTRRDQSGEIQTSGIALGTYENIEDAKDDLSLLFTQQGVGITARNSAGVLAQALSDNASGGASQLSVNALDFYTQFADPSQSAYSWSGAFQSARAAFAAGQVALYIGYASEDPEITQMNPNLDFAIAPVPQFKNTPPRDFGRAYAFAVTKASDNIQGASMAAELLDSASTSLQFSEALGIPSAARSALAQPSQGYGYGTLFNNMALITHIWSDPDPAQTDPLFQSMIEDTVSGASTPLQAVQTAGGQLAQILQPAQ